MRVRVRVRVRVRPHEAHLVGAEGRLEGARLLEVLEELDRGRVLAHGVLPAVEG